jgi:thiol:disulfide interchange protein/DsbC/DsbD-like thiol-disulfide interchange protein
MCRHPLARLLVRGAALIAAAAAAHGGVEGFVTGAVRDRHVEAELVPAVAAVVPGSTFTVGLRLQHDPHWHTYWVNPGEGGLPTEVFWSLPDGFTAGPIRWPLPEITDTGGILTYGYEGEIYLLVDLTAPADLTPGTTARLAAEVTWLMCKEACIPGGANLALELPVAAEAGPHPRWGAAIAQAETRIPPRREGVRAHAYRQNRDLTLVVEIDGSTNHDPGALYFFAATPTVDVGAPQSVRPLGEGRWAISTRLAAYAGEPSSLPGVLHAPQGLPLDGAPRAVELEVPLTVGPPPAHVIGALATGGGAPRGMLAILGLALLGGLILNLMPCVFPVIGIKIMGFVNQAGEERSRVVLHGLVFTAGVLVSFWALTALLLALRSGGAQLGWGFQLQSPGFVFVLTVVLLLFGLSMSGVFEVGGSLIGAGSRLQAKSGFGGSFFSGVLATVVATPCAAPFLAPALGAALALPAGASFATFTAIALGLSLPYLLLSAFPAAIKLLPRPGMWMETFKQGMAFLLYATVGYLVWVLAGQVEGDKFLSTLLALVVIAIAAWVYGRWTAPVRSPMVRRAGWAAAALLLAGGFVYGMPRTAAPADDDVVWEVWSEQRVRELVAAGRPVYVDFTARWCVTCQANKRVVFASSEVRRHFREAGVAALRADWTNRDDTITRALAELGRSAVPVNLVYLPGRAEPQLLPELLTPGIVLDALRGT